MEPVLCELMEHLLPHLDPVDFGRLQRASRSLRDASRCFEEAYLSHTRLVRVYRKAHVWDGKVQVSWSQGASVQYCDLEHKVGARDILGQLWSLKYQHDHAPRTLYVDCVLWPSAFDVGIVPCFLFKTKPALDAVFEIYGDDAARVDHGWPAYISCAEHPVWRCRSCPMGGRFCDGCCFPRLGETLPATLACG
jgi:hypothetical protein